MGDSTICIPPFDTDGSDQHPRVDAAIKGHDGTLMLVDCICLTDAEKIKDKISNLASLQVSGCTTCTRVVFAINLDEDVRVRRVGGVMLVRRREAEEFLGG